MRLPRPRLAVEWVNVPFRLSVRGMMIVVAIVAVLSGVTSRVWYNRRSEQFRQTAAGYALEEQSAKQLEQFVLKAAKRNSEWATSKAEEVKEIQKRIQTRERNQREPWGDIDFSLNLLKWDKEILMIEMKSAIRLAELADKERAIASAKARSAAYYAQLRKKYEYAALHPWFSVPPDPPPPNP